ncbi:MAG: hypothetical protein IT429_11450 [Gemmataceae bacterium]|nr:hypothetical protein [Gemmataceae bacterium]
MADGDRGGITQTGGNLAASNVSFRSFEAVAYTSAVNNATTLAALVDGPSFGFEYVDANALTVGTVSGLAGSIVGATTTNGPIAVVSVAGSLELTQAVNAGSGTVRLVSGDTVSQTGAGTIVTSGSLGVRAVNAINLGLSGNDVAAFAALVATAGQGIVFNEASGFLVGTVAADATGGFAQTSGGSANNADVVLTSPDLLTLGTNVSAGTGTIQLNAAGVVENAGASVGAAGLLLRGAGTFTLAQGNAVAILAAAASGPINFVDVDALTIGTVAGAAGIGTGGGDLTLSAGGLLTIGTGAGEDITAAGAVVQFLALAVTENAGSTIAAAALSLRGAGAFSLDQANDVATLAANTGALTYTDVNALTVGSVSGTNGIAVAASNAAAPADDATTTVGTFDPNAATFYLRGSNSAGEVNVARVAFGAPGWIPLVGDWNGDGQWTIGVFDPATATWYLRDSNTPGAPDIAPFRFGGAGWLPLVGDWDGNGTFTIGAFDPATATFYLRNRNSAGASDVTPFAYGAPGWTPLAGNWDGTGGWSIGVFDPATATFYLKNSSSAGAPDITPFIYGGPGWKPVVGDWNGESRWTVGVVDRAGTWYLRNTNSAGAPDIAPFAYGRGEWSPLAGDWRVSAFAGPTTVRLTTGGLLTIGTGSGQGITVPGGTADLNVGGVTEAAGSTIQAAGLRLRGAGTFALEQANNIAILAAATTGGPFRFTDANDLTLTTLDDTAGINTGGNPLALNAGRDLIATQAIDADGAEVTVNVGNAGPGVASFAVPIRAARATFNGGPNGDQFFLTPSASAALAVNGGDPMVLPGDVLSLIELAGVTVTGFESNLPGSGDSRITLRPILVTGNFIFDSRQPVRTTGVEFIQR